MTNFQKFQFLATFKNTSFIFLPYFKNVSSPQTSKLILFVAPFSPLRRDCLAYLLPSRSFFSLIIVITVFAIGKELSKANFVSMLHLQYLQECHTSQYFLKCHFTHFALQQVDTFMYLFYVYSALPQYGSLLLTKYTQHLKHPQFKYQW